jgi:hypothetical protein
MALFFHSRTKCTNTVKSNDKDANMQMNVRERESQANLMNELENLAVLAKGGQKMFRFLPWGRRLSKI